MRTQRGEKNRSLLICLHSTIVKTLINMAKSGILQLQLFILVYRRLKDVYCYISYLKQLVFYPMMIFEK